MIDRFISFELFHNLDDKFLCFYNRFCKVFSLWTKHCAATAHRLGVLLYKFCEEFDLHGMSMGPNPEGFGSNLSWNISPNATKFFTHVLTYFFLTDTYPDFFEQSSEWVKLMTINSTAQPIETHGKLAGIFP